MLKYYTGNIYPSEDTIFVFGSNPEGIHGVGSSKVAMYYFGAVYGQGEGLQGSSYGLPTTILDYDSYGWVPFDGKMPLEEITEYIRRMYKCAKENPDKKFKVAYRNQPNEKTLCGYTGAQLQSCFKNAGPIPDNVWFSKEWFESGNLE